MSEMLDRKIHTFEDWIYFGFKVEDDELTTQKEQESWLLDVLSDLIISKRPVEKEVLMKITDMDGPL